MYIVNRVSPNGHVSKPLKTFPTYDKAYEYCDYMNWEYVDISGVEWELEIDEIY